MLVAMAGLPGSGKSTLAACLQAELGVVVLDKDQVRAALFPPRVLDYSQTQDDVTMAAVYQAAAAILKADPRQAVVVDGRTFLLPGQMKPLLAMAASLGQQPRVIECVCDDEVARERLERDRGHPAGNRTFGLYLSLKAAAEPIPVPHLTLDTSRTPPEECVRRCLEYVGGADGLPLRPQGSSPRTARPAGGGTFQAGTNQQGLVRPVHLQASAPGPGGLGAGLTAGAPRKGGPPTWRPAP
jgi:adenylylsulfate kinase